MDTVGPDSLACCLASGSRPARSKPARQPCAPALARAAEAARCSAARAARPARGAYEGRLSWQP